MVGEIFGVLRDGGRLLLRHWPALLGLALIGVAARGGIQWLAVAVSDHWGLGGQLLISLAPLGFLVPVIVMLQLCGRSLPAVDAARRSAPARPLIEVMASLLIPCLGIYVSYGLLAADVSKFRNAAAIDEISQNPFDPATDYDFGARLGLYPFHIALLIVLGAWVLRWLLGRIEKRTKVWTLAILGALIEVLYTGQVARQSLEVEQWVSTRRVTVWISDTWAALVDRLGVVGDGAQALVGWIGGLLSSLDAVVIVPVSWLAIAAIVLGHQLARPPEEPLRHPFLDRLQVVPEPVRRTAAGLGDDVRGRFSAFWNALRMLREAGLWSMIVFGLTLIVAIRIPLLLSEVVRWVAGPMETDTWLAFAPIEEAAGLALSMAIVCPLLAAALDRMMRAQLAAAETVDQSGVSSVTNSGRS